MVSIISNIAALKTNKNLRDASADASLAAAKLSSGKSIIEASQDVGGLAVGTVLQTQQITLKAALNNAAQAQSMLGVADGGLSNINELLQRQKALAVQSNSGSLSDQNRVFLNAEFTALSAEIDRIALNADFNGIKLLDGSLFSEKSITTASKINSISAKGTFEFDATNTKIAANDTIKIAGIDFTAVASNASGAQFDISGGTGGSAIVTALKNAITRIQLSTDANDAANKKILNGFSFEAQSTKLTITALNSGISNDAIQISTTIADTSVTGAEIKFNNENIVNAGGGTLTAITFAAAGASGVKGDLYAGDMATTVNAFNGSETTIAIGSVGDTILKSLAVTSAANTGVNASGISNNSAFIGKISGMKASYIDPGVADLSIQIGDYTYSASGVTTNPTSATIVRFASQSPGGGYFDLQFDSSTNSGQTAITSQDDADKFADRINTALSRISFHQKRSISSYLGNGNVYAAKSNTAIGNLSGSSVQLISNRFSDLKISDVSVSAPVEGGSNGSISFTINGQKYAGGFDKNGTPLSSGIGSSLTSSGGSSGVYGFVNENDANQILLFKYTSSTALDFSNEANAAAVEKALEKAFGIDSANSAVMFQVGTKYENGIDISIEGSSTKSIYLDDNGSYRSIDITTQANSENANKVLDGAIEKVIALRAKIGSLQSRFNYASSNISTSMQNIDSARSVFLDADIGSESTNFAQAQVRAQAAIAMLAQVNQLSQNLLQLLR